MLKEEIIIENEEESSLAGKIKKLKKELKECQKEKAEYLAGWQRAKADFINARREEEKKRENFFKLAKRQLLEELLDLIDSFEMAFRNNDLWVRLDKDWQSGIENMYDQLKKILKKHNVKVIESLNKIFNPKEHESVESISIDDKGQDNIVLEEIRKGYKIDEFVLRPAKVKVGIYKK